ncbi:hypothetical protein OG292_18195 [Streptomyces sp. NBC_01511]|uniref:hypothetical protein n=1 Tax=Streptomyces sp. NBC_01511 TaxID=2903889 RepID=UPI00386BCB36
MPGIDSVRAAGHRPDHLANGVTARRHFVDLLTPEQIEAFATIGETVAGRLTERDG